LKSNRQGFTHIEFLIVLTIAEIRISLAIIGL
jgi:hypothetical protein